LTLALLLLLISSAIPVEAATFTVNSTNDVNDGTCNSGHCSLREAIITANTNPGADNIIFNMSGPAPYIIQPTTNLPPLNEAVIIDGLTQPGYSGTPLIELDGSLIPNPLPPGQNIGLYVNSDNSTVRGLVINQFTSAGIGIIGDNNIIQGNFVGTDVTGTLDRGNGTGIFIFEANGNLIGGTTVGARNLISGNIIGVGLDGTSNTVQGNYIGTDVTGTLDLGGIIGISVSQENANNNLIGGINAGAGNLIAFNQVGIGMEQTVGDPFGDFSTGVGILGNSIHSNEGTSTAVAWLGIDLGPSSQQGVTPNDLGDADIGPNNLQNFPVLTGVNRLLGNTGISGTLNSIANTTFRLEFFANAACDPSLHGEGEIFLGFGTTTTNGSGNAAFSLNLPLTVLPGSFITATVTDPNNNTSEFSQCFAASGTAADLSVNQSDSPNPVVVNNNLIYTIIVANNGPDPATGVIITDTLPGNVTLVSATPLQGSCTSGSGLVSCNLGSLNAGWSTSITVVLQPTVAGIITNQVNAAANEPDSNLANNTSSANTNVILPPTSTYTPTNTLTPLLPTATATPTLPPAPPPYTPPPTLTASDVPSATDVPPPTNTPTPPPIPFLLPSATTTNTPIPPPPPFNP
jgi:uncharacterized repeat protein (TIGR01451 family)/CSLREA domain-containing protein